MTKSRGVRGAAGGCAVASLVYLLARGLLTLGPIVAIECVVSDRECDCRREKRREHDRQQHQQLKRHRIWHNV